jgi:hypothetical protein
MDCTRTALCAVTGQAPGVIDVEIRRVAAAAGDTMDTTVSTAPRHWGVALKAMGYTWHTLRDGNSPRIAIDEFLMANVGSTDLVLVLAFDDTKGDGHVFAAQGDMFVDCHTAGRIEKFASLPADLRRFLVKYVLHVVNA